MNRAPLGGAVLQGVAFAMMAACRLTSILFIAHVRDLGSVPVAAASVRDGGLRRPGLPSLGLVVWRPIRLCLSARPRCKQRPPTEAQEGMLSGAAGVLVSPSHGFLVYQPWLLFAALALIPAVRRGIERRVAPVPRGWAVFTVCYFALHLSLISLVLDLCRNANVTDPRDKVYGILGLLPPNFTISISPDYELFLPTSI